MQKIPYDNSTTFFLNYQLFLPMDISIHIPDTAPVKVISKILEGLDYSNLMKAYFDNKGRRPKIEPCIMFFIIAYAMYDGIYSTRDIEKNCRENINFMWILRGRPVPDHNTIARFITNNIQNIQDLFDQFVKKLLEFDEIDLENIFIDGSKIQANANRYTFVWKKAVLKNYEKLKLKAIEFWSSFNEENETEFNDIYEIKEYLDKKIKEEKIQFKKGRGKRKSKIQKEYEKVLSYINKEIEYQNHLSICQNRNSYSKTDTDATFMRMKEDHINGQLKPAYNLQIGVNSEYIVGLDVFCTCADMKTLLPFLGMLENRELKFQNVVADAGYESEENYEYLETNDYISYIKPQNYAKKKTKKFKNDISKVENMKYDKEKDLYICSNGKKLEYLKTEKKQNVSGYVSEKRIYECKSCCGCAMSSMCKKSKDNKRISVARKFMEYREQSEKNLTSEKGIQMRINRSIQVEGAFGVLKQNMKLSRFKYRGIEKVRNEILLLCLGYNLRKYVHKIKQKRQGMKLHSVKIS